MFREDRNAQGCLNPFCLANSEKLHAYIIESNATFGTVVDEFFLYVPTGRIYLSS